MKRTKWFDAVRVYPVRIGWYEYRILRGPVTRLFYGGDGRWRTRLVSPYSVPAFPGDQWRGLAEPAKEFR